MTKKTFFLKNPFSTKKTKFSKVFSNVFVDSENLPQKTTLIRGHPLLLRNRTIQSKAIIPQFFCMKK